MGVVFNYLGTEVLFLSPVPAGRDFSRPHQPLPCRILLPTSFHSNSLPIQHTSQNGEFIFMPVPVAPRDSLN